ncbi:type II toxin-antitoxin system Phd/YefM family antitoxin [Cellulomonas taurus]|uniref:type II toxin-antitoxin system Phd/YefM family antitoxin n=1 Tax=Cellulomonas taurus TaxID=2729175 RepID=UPI00145F2AE1|nr:type II toxin-antitoxin system prevent-host-death family antitoxin [Cellulomonas taurus]
MTVADAARDLPRLVDDLRPGEPVQITVDSRPAAVLLHPDELESLLETLAWLQEPHASDDVRRARLDLAHGRTVDGAAARERYLGPTT